MRPDPQCLLVAAEKRPPPVRGAGLHAAQQLLELLPSHRELRFNLPLAEEQELSFQIQFHCAVTRDGEEGSCFGLSLQHGVPQGSPSLLLPRGWVPTSPRGFLAAQRPGFSPLLKVTQADPCSGRLAALRQYWGRR